MAIKQLNPYLFFDGTAAKAIQHYEEVFGTNAEELKRFSDLPHGDVPPGGDRVMFARLRIGPRVIMVGDTQAGTPAPAAGSTHLMVDFDDLAEMKAKFEALSEGGKVEQRLQQVPWGATYGALIDAYGISWMFNCAAKQG